MKLACIIGALLANISLPEVRASRLINSKEAEQQHQHLNQGNQTTAVSKKEKSKTHLRRLGYVQYQGKSKEFVIKNIDANAYDFINWGFATPKNGEIVAFQPQIDLYDFYDGDCMEAGCKRGAYHEVEKLTAKNPNLKVLISCGGWGPYYKEFSAIAASEANRTKFSNSVVKFIRENGFNGVDIDWEYPVTGQKQTYDAIKPGDEVGKADDKHNYSLMLKSLSQALATAGKADSQKYYLSIAVGASPNNIVNVEYEVVHQYVDFINMMTYIINAPEMFYHGSNFGAPLHASPNDPAGGEEAKKSNIAAAVQTLIDRAVPKEKINVGVIASGFGYAGVTTPPFSNYTGAAFKDELLLPDLLKNYVNKNGYVRHWDKNAQQPWLYNAEKQIMITYDDEESYKSKAQWAADKGIGGIFLWELKQDTAADDVAWNSVNQVLAKKGLV